MHSILWKQKRLPINTIMVLLVPITCKMLQYLMNEGDLIYWYYQCTSNAQVNCYKKVIMTKTGRSHCFHGFSYYPCFAPGGFNHSLCHGYSVIDLFVLNERNSFNIPSCTLWGRFWKCFWVEFVKRLFPRTFDTT